MQDECFLNDDITKWLTIIHNHNEWVNYMENFINEKGKMIK